MSKQNDEILLELFASTTAVPNILLEYYREFKLNEAEVVFIIELLRLKAQGLDLSIEGLKQAGHYSAADISSIVPALVEKGFIALNQKCAISLQGLFDHLREAWAWQETKNRECKEEKELKSSVEQEFSALYLKFKEEFGRPLSPIEGEQLKDWFSVLGMNGEMIYEALKKSVLLDKLSFRYIGAILDDWHRKGYSSLNDISAADSKKAKETKEKDKKKKYRQDQVVDIFDDDVFGVN